MRLWSESSELSRQPGLGLLGGLAVFPEEDVNELVLDLGPAFDNSVLEF